MDPRMQKLAQLRARTDRQLVELISAALDRGFAYARVLDATKSQAEWTASREFHQRAKNAWCEARRLLTALDGSEEKDHAALLRRAEILRAELDQLSAEIFPVRRAACF